jgi:quercetin dioxygenase-like cupin family protein
MQLLQGKGNMAHIKRWITSQCHLRFIIYGLSIVGLFAILIACAGDDDEDMSMDGLGGTSTIEVLAEEQVDTLPGGPHSWVAHEMRMEPASEPVTHQHELGFIYASDGGHTVMIDGEEVQLEAGQSVFIGQDVEHTHGEGAFWDIRLTGPNASPPAGLEDAAQVFASPELEGIPETPVDIRFIFAELPEGGETSVHTHPGSEYIYMIQGDIDYQNAIVGTEPMTVGDHHSLPANTAVQKRNPDGGPAVFLSWFIVDSDEPFAPEASFE